MTPNRYNRCLKVLRLSQRYLAELVGCSSRLPGTWATGDQTIPEPIAVWLEQWVQLRKMAPMPRPPRNWRHNKLPAGVTMTRSRFRYCLTFLRITHRDLAEMLGCSHIKPDDWSRNKGVIPHLVGEWLEQCVRARKAVPDPRPPRDWRRHRPPGSRPPRGPATPPVWLRYDGEILRLAEVCRLTGINQRVIQTRVRTRGETHQQALDHFLAATDWAA